MISGRSLVILALPTVIFFSGCSHFSLSGNTSEYASSSSEARKTYRNEKFGFELQYPASWKMNDESSNRALTGLDIIFLTGSGGMDEGIKMDASKAKTVRDVVRNFDKPMIKGTADTTIGGEKGERLLMNGLYLFFVKHGDTMYEFQTKGKLIDNHVIDSVKFLK